MEKQKTKVSLVLGGGGARGITHIGVIQFLEEMGYDIVSVSGTSIGAIVGGLYVTGTLEAYTKWLLTLSYFDVITMMDPTFFSNGIIKGKKLMAEVKRIVGDTQIEDLEKTYTAVATDIVTGKEYWFQEGSLYKAMRASMSIPNIFVPMSYGDRVFVDGGVVNPVPVTPTLSDSSDITIAVSLTGDEMDGSRGIQFDKDVKKGLKQFDQKQPLNHQLGYFEIASRSIDIMQASISRFKLASTPPDLVIEIPKNICGLFDLHKAKELIAYGREATEAAFMGQRVSEPLENIDTIPKTEPKKVKKTDLKMPDTDQ